MKLSIWQLLIESAGGATLGAMAAWESRVLPEFLRESRDLSTRKPKR